jgi:hypothetical protein
MVGKMSSSRFKPDLAVDDSDPILARRSRLLERGDSAAEQQ